MKVLWLCLTFLLLMMNQPHVSGRPIHIKAAPHLSQNEGDWFVGFYQGHFVLRLGKDVTVIPEANHSLWLVYYFLKVSLTHTANALFPGLPDAVQGAQRLVRYAKGQPACLEQTVSIEHPVARRLLSLKTGCIDDQPVWWFYPLPAKNVDLSEAASLSGGLVDVWHELDSNHVQSFAIIPYDDADRNQLAIYACQAKHHCTLIDIKKEYGHPSEKSWLLHQIMARKGWFEFPWLSNRYKDKEKETLSALDFNTLEDVAHSLFCYFNQENRDERADIQCGKHVVMAKQGDQHWPIILPKQYRYAPVAIPWLVSQTVSPTGVPDV